MLFLFHKLHGLGNDFVLIDGTQTDCQNFEDCLTPKLIRQWGDRHTGIGFDQLLVLQQDQHKGEQQWQLQFYNSDGSAAKQCGNGLRACALWLHRQGHFGALKETPDSTINVKTEGGLIALSVLSSDADQPQYCVDLPAPKMVGAIQDYKYPARFEQAQAVNVGNPHLIILCDDPEQQRKQLGADLVNDQCLFDTLDSEIPLFGSGCNISFVDYKSRPVKLFVWERGAGPTRACGSAACAVAAVLSTLSNVDPERGLEIVQPGGSLMLKYINEKTLRMSGSATYVYSGTISTN